MMTRTDALTQIAHGLRNLDGLTAAESLESMSPNMRMALDPKDVAFFKRHGGHPARSVARACQDGRIWHGDNALAARRLRA